MMNIAFLALRDAYPCPQQQVAEGVVVFGAKERDGFVEDEVHEGSPDNKKAGETNPVQGNVSPAGEVRRMPRIKRREQLPAPVSVLIHTPPEYALPCVNS